MTTLQAAIEAIKSIRISTATKNVKNNDIANELLGKYKGILPKGRTSTKFIKGLRNGLYGKIK